MILTRTLDFALSKHRFGEQITHLVTIIGFYIPPNVKSPSNLNPLDSSECFPYDEFITPVRQHSISDKPSLLH